MQTKTKFVKHCPFCGGTASAIKHPITSDISISCDDCFATLGGEEARRRWNTRFYTGED